jgi:hypothetical protein
MAQTTDGRWTTAQLQEPLLGANPGHVSTAANCCSERGILGSCGQFMLPRLSPSPCTGPLLLPPPLAPARPHLCCVGAKGHHPDLVHGCLPHQHSTRGAQRRHAGAVRGRGAPVAAGEEGWQRYQVR